MIPFVRAHRDVGELRWEIAGPKFRIIRRIDSRLPRQKPRLGIGGELLRTGLSVCVCVLCVCATRNNDLHRRLALTDHTY